MEHTEMVYLQESLKLRERQSTALERIAAVVEKLSAEEDERAKRNSPWDWLANFPPEALQWAKDSAADPSSDPHGWALIAWLNAGIESGHISAVAP